MAATQTTFTTSQFFTVPDGIDKITVECWGAQGGASFGTPNTTGLGGYIKSEVDVTPGEVLGIFIGTKPTNTPGAGNNGGGQGGPSSSPGGGGGGASDVRRYHIVNVLPVQQRNLNDGTATGWQGLPDPGNGSAVTTSLAAATVATPRGIFYSFTDGFDRSDRVLNGDNGWTTAGDWTISGNDAFLRITGGVNAQGIVPVLRSDTVTQAKRHYVSAFMNSVGSFGVTGEGVIWGYVDSSNYWYAEWDNTTNKVAVYKVQSGTRTSVAVSTATASLFCTITVDHNFVSGALTILMKGDGPLNTAYSGNQPWTVTNGKIGFFGRGDGSGSLFSSRYVCGNFTTEVSGNTDFGTIPTAMDGQATTLMPYRFAAGDYWYGTPSGVLGFPAEAGATYNLSTRLWYSDTANSAFIYGSIAWYNSTGGLLSTTNATRVRQVLASGASTEVSGNGIQPTRSQWLSIGFSGIVAPNGAAYGQVVFHSSGNSDSVWHFWHNRIGVYKTTINGPIIDNAPSDTRIIVGGGGGGAGTRSSGADGLTVRDGGPGGALIGGNGNAPYPVSSSNGWTISSASTSIATGVTINVASPSTTPANTLVKLEAFAGPVNNVIGATVDDTGFLTTDGYRNFTGGYTNVSFTPGPAASGITHWVLAGAVSGPAKVLGIFLVDPFPLGGKGGTQLAGGAPGTPPNGGGTTATAGTLGQGGQGAGQGPSTLGTGAGGGGGGYYGGGGGGWYSSSDMPGGGGGSSYSSAAILANAQGVRPGNGQVVFTYDVTVTNFVGWGIPIRSNYVPTIKIGGVHVTGIAAEALVTTAIYESRVTGLAVEALITTAIYESRVTGLAAEALITTAVYESRVTGLAAEALITTDTAESRVTGLAVQVLITN